MIGFEFMSLRRPKVTAFSPLDTAPVAWYDPSDLSTLFQDTAGTIPVANDGDPVALMKDKSGSGHDMVQSSLASQPTYRTQGGQIWIEADGVDDRMLVNSRLGMSANPDIAVIFAMRALSNAGSVQRVIHIGASNASATLSCAMGSDRFSWRFNNGNTRFNTPTVGSDHVMTWARQAGSTYGASQFYLDGVEQAQVSNANAGSTPGNTSAQTALFSHGTLQANQAHVRFYGGVILASSNLADIAKCETWLGTKI